MPASGWIRKWKGNQATSDPLISLIRAATRGERIEQLLELGARALLAAGDADRAGLWMAGNRRGETGQGSVMELKPGPIPIEWKRLDVSTPFLRAALDSPEPMRVELGSNQAMTHLGPLVGMRSAIWIPLRTRNCTLGLAMVAYSGVTGNAEMEMLRLRADEISLAVQQHRDSLRAELAAEELRAQLHLFRAILCGVSADSILPQIARAARHHLQAEFVAVGRGSEAPILGEGFEGPAEWASAIRQRPLVALWHKAFHEGSDCEIPGEAISARMNSVSSVAPRSAFGGAGQALDRVIAIPIEARSRVGGVVLAGLLAGEDSAEDIARLESYVLLASSALDREFAREERAAGTRSLLKLIEASAESIAVIDEHGRLRESSRSAAEVLNLPWSLREETLLEDCFSSVARDAVAEWRKELDSSESVQAPRSEKAPASLEAVLRGGGIVRLHSRSRVEGLGVEASRWVIQIEDRGAELTLRQAQGRLEAEMAGLVDSIESGVLIVDGGGSVRMASERLGAILGFESRKLLELGTIDALIDTVTNHFAHPAEAAARWRERLRHTEEAGWDEFELARPSRRIVERFARPLHTPDGARVGWLEVYRDITGQRLIQSKLLQTEKMAALGQLVSGIAHELNNPLTSIQGYAQLLVSRNSSAERAGDARRISQQAERAARIVKNLLLFSRETKPERRAVNLNEVIERTLSLRAYELKLENIAVELALDPGLPQTLADAAQLQQVVLNLIVNAEQAIQQGRGEEARHGRILIRTRRLAGDRIEMQISDDGPGISPEVASRIFDPFFTTKPAGLGTGLGLSIVYGIIQEHGGEVSVESQPGRGATLTVELPALSVAGFDFARGEQAADARASTVVPLSAAPVAARAERILVVEDEPTVAELIADVLTDEGHQVDMFLDSREALRRLEEKNYALIICDLKMPHMDGPGLYRALVRRGSPSQHRILFVTGDTMSPRTFDFLKSSGLPYLAKPFLVEELKAAVREALPSARGATINAGVTEWPQAAGREK